jgi:hypothetical protein
MGALLLIRLALLALAEKRRVERHHNLPPGIIRICNVDKCMRFPNENNCSAEDGSSAQWQPSHHYDTSKSDGEQQRNEGAWTRCLSIGKRPLCGRKGAPIELSWDRRKSLQLAIERESEQFATEIEQAHARAHQLPNPPAWVEREQKERSELEAGQAEIAALLAARRSAATGDATCVQSLPMFFVHNGNFGDEINPDLGAVILGNQKRHMGVLYVRRSKGERRTLTNEPRRANASLSMGTWMWTTVAATNHPKILGVGSTLKEAQPGDVIVGVGAKAERTELGFASEPNLSGPTLAALRNESTTIAALRGPLTCRHIAKRGVIVDCETVAFGDPGVMTHLLLPWWRHLKWMPGRRVQRQPMLCFVPQMSDTAGRHNVFVQAYKSPCRRAWNATIRVINPASPRFWPNAFARALQTCDLVVSTALHGVIAADALRVPSVWLANLTSAAARNMTRYSFALQQRNMESPFKYLDYFAGIGKPVARVESMDQAIEMLHKHRPPEPRLTVAELLSITRRFVNAFPFRRVCRSVAQAAESYAAICASGSKDKSWCKKLKAGRAKRGPR